MTILATYLATLGGPKTDWLMVEGSGTGTLRGYSTDPAFGSLSGLTTVNGATILRITQSSEEVKGSPVYLFGVTLSGVRSAGFWYSLEIDGHGTILESSNVNVTNDGVNTAWVFSANVSAVIDGVGTCTGRFT